MPGIPIDCALQRKVKSLFSGGSLFCCLLLNGGFFSGLLCGSLSLFFLRSLQGCLSSAKLFCVLGNNNHGHVYLYILVEVHNSLILTHVRSIAHGDDLAVDRNALFSQSSNNLSHTYATIGDTRCTNLSGNLQGDALELLGALFGGSLLGSQLVSLLTQVLGEHLLGRSRSHDGLTLRNQVVAAITILHVNDLVLVTQTDNGATLRRQHTR